MKNKELCIKSWFWILWTSIVVICVYFIIHNAQWFVGDDAIVIRHTGFGKAFLLSDTVNPAAGRFYPFSYLVYNVLLLFGSNHISPTAHYILHSVFFILFVVLFTILVLKVLEDQSGEWKYVVALLTIVVFIGRVYPQYVECFSTAWFDYSLLAVFVFFSIMFYKKQKWGYGIVALLCVNYYCYCGERSFVLPLSMGICAILFQRKTLSSKEKAFNWCLVGSALLFLILYAILILPHIESVYDSAHGESVGILENAVKMIWAQKLLVIGLVLSFVRLVDIVLSKKVYTYYDNLLLAAAACCCGSFILKLNWSLYYNDFALMVLVAILYFSVIYLKKKWTLVLFVFLAVFYGRKIPVTIQRNQQLREFTYREMVLLSNKIDNADAVYWYVPDEDIRSYKSILRDWKYASLCTYLGWLRYDSNFSITQMKDIRDEGNTIWLMPSENRLLFPNDTKLSEEGKLVFDIYSIQGYQIGVYDK